MRPSPVESRPPPCRWRSADRIGRRSRIHRRSSHAIAPWSEPRRRSGRCAPPADFENICVANAATFSIRSITARQEIDRETLYPKRGWQRRPSDADAREIAALSPTQGIAKVPGQRGGHLRSVTSTRSQHSPIAHYQAKSAVAFRTCLENALNVHER